MTQGSDSSTFNVGRGLVALLVFTSYLTQLLGCQPVRGEDEPVPESAPLAASTTRLDVPADTILPTNAPNQVAPLSVERTVQVSDDGAAQVSIPLWTPKGRSGIEPQLAVTYSSRSGNGPLGVGFSLSGLSQISHCAPLLAHTGRVWSLSHEGSDYCLDGQRLVPIAGSSTEFRTEIDSYARILAEGTDPITQVPGKFRVFSPDGRVLTFGGTTDGTLDAISNEYLPDGQGGAKTRPTPVRMYWMLTTVEDRFGNSLRVLYDRSAPTDPAAWIRPRQIEYTAFAGSAAAPAELARRKVRFFYKPRIDPSVGYSAGVRVSVDFLLDRLEMRAPGPRDPNAGSSFADDVLQKTYRFEYQNGSTSMRSLLAKLHECDGLAVCKPPLTFSWTDETYKFATEAIAMVADAAPDTRLQPFGLGRGRLALDYYLGTTWATVGVAIEGQHHRLGVDVSRYLHSDPALGGAFTPVISKAAVTWAEVPDCGKRELSSAIYGPRAVDWVGNGKSDHAALSCGAQAIPTKGTWEYRKSYSRGDGLVGVTLPPGARSFFWLDFNGDQSNELAWVGGTGTDAQIRTGPPIRLPDSGLLASSPPGTLNGPTLQAIDLYGSGTHYLLGYKAGDTQYMHAVGGANLWWAGTALSLPVPFFAAWPQAQLDLFKPGLVTADVNGDGLQDVIAVGLDLTTAKLRLDLSLNTGKGFAPRVTSLRAAGTLVGARVSAADVNADGRQDLVFHSRGEPVQVLLGQEDLATAKLMALPVDVGDDSNWSLVGDFTADGLLDFSFRKGVDLYLTRNTTRADLLTAVTGFGYGHAFTYSPLWSAGGSSKFDGDAKLRPAPDSMLVVSNLALKARGTTKRSWSYTYEEGRHDTQGYGWLGFARRTVVDEQTGVRTTTEYDNSSFLTARQPKSELATHPVELGVMRTRRTNWTYETVLIPSAGPATAYQRYAKKRVEGVEENGVQISSTEQSFTLDPYGTETASASSASSVRSGVGYRETVSSTLTGSFDAALWLRTGPWVQTNTWSCTLASGAACASNGSSLEARTTRLTYDGTGHVSSVELAPDLAGEQPQAHESGHYLKRTFGFDAFGQLNSVTEKSADGERKELIAYDDLEAIYPAQSSVRLNGTDRRAARFAFHPGLGVLAAVEDGNGLRTRLQYDGFGRPRRTLPPASGAEELTYSLEDSVLPAVLSKTAGGPETKVKYDELGRVTSSAYRGFAGDWVTSETDYDWVGRVRRRSAPHRPTEPTRYETFSYDGLDRVTEQLHPDGTRLRSEFQVTADGVLSSTWDEEDRVTRQLIDSQGRLLESREPLASAVLTTRYEYGPFGLRTAVVDPQGKRLEMRYDRLGRAERVVDPNAGVGLRRFNGFGEVKWEANSDAWQTSGLVTAFTRDELGRVTSAKVTSGAAVKEQVSLEWDQATYGLFKLSSATRTPADAAREVKTTFEYDPLGRPASTAWTLQGATFSLSQTYDPYGRPAVLTYPKTKDGRTVSVEYGYTPHGALWNIRDVATQTSLWTGYDYNGRGQLTADRFGTGIDRLQRYDADGQLRFIDVRAQQKPIQQLAYEYTPTGNMRARHDLQLKTSESFEYDALDRLRKWSVLQNCQASSTEYLYSNSGNLNARVGAGGSPSASYLYDETGATSPPHAVAEATLGAESFSYRYDAQGNQRARINNTAGTTESIDYTAFNLPEVVRRGVTGQLGQVVASFDYDATGARVRKQSAQGEVIYIGGLYQRRTAGADVRHLYQVNGPQGVIAELELKDGVVGREVRYVATDRYGTPDVTMDAAGAVLARMKHDPFGERRSETDLRQVYVGSYTGMKAGFTGHEQDDELGLINMRGRMFDPRLGRFLTADPLVAAEGSAQALNGYAYVLNNPLRYVDPTGFDPAAVITRHYGGDEITGRAYLASGQFESPNKWTLPLSGGAAAAAAASPAQMTDDLGASSGPSRTGWGSTDRASLGSGVAHFAVGVAKGAVTGVASAYALGLIAGLCIICAGVIVVGLAAYSAYKLINGGAEQIYESAERIVTGNGTNGDFEGVGDIVGGFAGAGAAKSAFGFGFSQSSSAMRSVAAARAAAAGAELTGGCFVAGTAVLTAGGERPIEEIAVGDWIWAWDEHSQEPGWHQVLNTFLKLDRAVLRITLESDDGAREELGVTSEHPFWVEGKGWTPARLLELGSSVQTARGASVRVRALAMDAAPVAVYNLEVEGAHTYFVGRSEAWVHNAGSTIGGGPSGGRSGTYGELRAAGAKDGHHVVQDAAVRDLPGYSRSGAPAVELPGPSTSVGSPHYRATQVQRQRGGGTYGAERRIGYKALRRAGLSEAEARQQLKMADEYFESIGVTPSTPTRLPGNRY